MRKTFFWAFAVLTFILTGCSSTNSPIKCHVEGTVEGTDGQALVIPYGGSSSDAIASFNIYDGKFSGTFKGLQNTAYELVIWNQGQGIFTYFFADKGGVKFTCDNNADSPVTFTASNKNNTAFLKERKEEDSKFAARWIELDAKGARLEEQKALLSERTYELLEKVQSQSIPQEKKTDYYDQIRQMESDSTIYSPQALEWLKEQDSLLKEQQEFRRNYIESHPDMASFFLLYTEIDSQSKDGKDITPLAETYNKVFSSKFPNHIYHSTINRIISQN